MIHVTENTNKNIIYDSLYICKLFLLLKLLNHVNAPLVYTVVAETANQLTLNYSTLHCGNT